MRMSNRLIGGAFVLAIAAAGCSSAAATPAPATPAPATPAPATAAPGSAAPASAAPAPAVVITSGNAVEAKPVGSIGTVLVAGNNGMTLYTFAKDTADSGKSACAVGGCLTKWPALTVANAALAVGGSGVTGKLGTITRDDNGQIQVTYKGLPLYFFSGDKAPGDSNGVYTNWAAVAP